VVPARRPILPKSASRCRACERKEENLCNGDERRASPEKIAQALPGPELRSPLGEPFFILIVLAGASRVSSGLGRCRKTSRIP
jgi:hypothetical protein